ncbi:hypothetical protein BDZ89DRAFT_1070069, partial [Hymenopellis radicata]
RRPAASNDTTNRATRTRSGPCPATNETRPLSSKTQPTRSETRANEGQDVNREERPASPRESDQRGTGHDRPT